MSHSRVKEDFLCSSPYLPVNEFAADASLEKPAATVARQYTVMLAAGRVAAHDAREPQCFGFGHGDLATGGSVVSGNRGSRRRRRPRRCDRDLLLLLLYGARCRHAKRQRPVSHRITRIRSVCNETTAAVIAYKAYVTGTRQPPRWADTTSANSILCELYILQKYFFLLFKFFNENRDIISVLFWVCKVLRSSFWNFTRLPNNWYTYMVVCGRPHGCFKEKSSSYV